MTMMRPALIFSAVLHGAYEGGGEREGGRGFAAQTWPPSHPAATAQLSAAHHATGHPAAHPIPHPLHLVAEEARLSSLDR